MRRLLPWSVALAIAAAIGAARRVAAPGGPPSGPLVPPDPPPAVATRLPGDEAAVAPAPPPTEAAPPSPVGPAAETPAADRVAPGRAPRDGSDAFRAAVAILERSDQSVAAVAQAGERLKAGLITPQQAYRELEAARVRHQRLLQEAATLRGDPIAAALLREVIELRLAAGRILLDPSLPLQAGERLERALHLSATADRVAARLRAGTQP